MTRAEILERLHSVMEESSVDEVDWADVDESTSIESFGFDSLSVLDLIFDLEQEYGVQIQPEEMPAIKQVGDLVTFLVERIS
jgi:acyl carrier protein